YTASLIAKDFYRIGLNTKTLLKDFTKKIEDFITGGSKYCLIREALGGLSVLFFLPLKIGDRV
ncbi:hypothetical protein V2W45_1254855, partial [Cenococcum geophilum]